MSAAETKFDAVATAKQIISRLGECSQYAADEAKLWAKGDKCRIYFGRKYIELFADASCDLGSNPYGVSAIVSDYCRLR